MNLFETRALYRAAQLTKREYINAMHQLHEHLFEYAEFVGDSDIESIEISDSLVVFTVRRTGLRMICDPRDKRMTPIEILNFCGYEQPEMMAILHLLEPGQIVFDIGANVGWYTMNIARLVERVHVHSFEPIPATFHYLQQNLQLNNLPNVSLHNFGFFNCDQEMPFFFYPEGSGNASAVNVSDSVQAERIVCIVKTLDRFVEETNTTVDFIKCDVEGAELFVFQGGLRILRQQKPIIFAEMLRKWAAKFNYHPNAIIQLLGEIGYRCFTVREDHLTEFFMMDDDTLDTNFFFLHGTKHAAKIKSGLVRS
ncbi:MAG: FkbM family methyltransferase [Bacteroidetes bacterium]|nr:FkbM family methyltransferase [Bacteroidota bacterium]